MKINFAAIKFRPSLLDEPVTIKDFHKQLANAIWQSKDIAAGKFALKLFDNPDIEANEQEVGFIREAVEGFTQWAKSPILEILNNKK